MTLFFLRRDIIEFVTVVALDMADFITRRATHADCDEICRLFQEQVSCGDERTPPSAETLKKDGLGESFHVLVAEDQEDINKPLIGYLFFHFIYSTFEGKAMFLSEVYISPEFQKKPVAKELFILLLKISKEENCCRVHWAATDNDKLKNEYTSIFNPLKLMEEEGWCTYRLTKEQLLTF